MTTRADVRAPSLTLAIADLYATCPDRRNGAPIVGCPCCVRLVDAYELGRAERESIPLRLLSRFAFKSMTTWGCPEDLRSLVPPILEALAHRSIPVAPQVPFSRMQLAGVASWSAQEHAAIERFLVAWMDVATHGEGFGASEIVESATIAGFPIEPVLAVWETADSLESLTDLARCLIEGAVWQYAERAENGATHRSAPFHAWLGSVPVRAAIERAISTHIDDTYDYLWNDALEAWARRVARGESPLE